MIEIIQGKIQNQHTDVIVNSSNADLMWENTTMNGDVHIKAGSVFTKSCQKYVKENGSLSVGDIVPISEVGELNCKEVWNVFSPWWDIHEEYIGLHIKLINNIATKFKNSEFKSISIPMIGCGAFLLPEQFVIKNTIQLCSYFFSDNPDKLCVILPYTDAQYKLCIQTLDQVKEIKNKDESKGI